jgi:hypothetical protein
MLVGSRLRRGGMRASPKWKPRSTRKCAAARISGGWASQRARPRFRTRAIRPENSAVAGSARTKAAVGTAVPGNAVSAGIDAARRGDACRTISASCGGRGERQPTKAGKAHRRPAPAFQLAALFRLPEHHFIVLRWTASAGAGNCDRCFVAGAGYNASPLRTRSLSQSVYFFQPRHRYAGDGPYYPAGPLRRRFPQEEGDRSRPETNGSLMFFADFRLMRTAACRSASRIQNNQTMIAVNKSIP